MIKSLFTTEQIEIMFANSRQTKIDHIGNHFPVVSLRILGTDMHWLLSELNPDFPNIAFGLCDLGLGFPEIGYVDLDELEQAMLRRKGCIFVTDPKFKATKSLLDYASDARDVGFIVI